MTTSHPFGATLAEIRRRRRLSQARLAEAAGYEKPRTDAGNGKIEATIEECGSGACNTLPRDRTVRSCPMTESTKDWRYSPVVSTLYPDGISPADRFWLRVNRIQDDECWLWQGHFNASGYGVFNLRDLNLAHRAAWVFANGDIPDGLYVYHRCDNRACCNPLHLFLGTQQDNMTDCARKGRKARGEWAANARLTEGQVLLIRERFSNWEHLDSLARAFGVSQRTVSSIVRGETWQHVGGPVSRGPRTGSDNPRAILNEESVRVIRRRFSAGETQTAIAADFGITPQNVYSIVRRLTWKRVA